MSYGWITAARNMSHVFVVVGSRGTISFEVLSVRRLPPGCKYFLFVVSGSHTDPPVQKGRTQFDCAHSGGRFAASTAHQHKNLGQDVRAASGSAAHRTACSSTLLPLVRPPVSLFRLLVFKMGNGHLVFQKQKKFEEIKCNG